jgi:hypothetical protein
VKPKTQVQKPNLGHPPKSRRGEIVHSFGKEKPEMAA